MKSITQNYVEQVQTTFETMRRQALFYYNHILKIAYRLNHIQEFESDLFAWAIKNELIKKVIIKL